MVDEATMTQDDFLPICSCLPERILSRIEARLAMTGSDERVCDYLFRAMPEHIKLQLLRSYDEIAELEHALAVERFGGKTVGAIEALIAHDERDDAIDKKKATDTHRIFVSWIAQAKDADVIRVIAKAL
jgi:hypothetical protein